MIRAVRRGINSVEELEKVEKEEAEREEQRQRGDRPASAAGNELPSGFLASWDTVYPEVALTPSVLTEFNKCFFPLGFSSFILINTFVSIIKGSSGITIKGS